MLEDPGYSQERDLAQQVLIEMHGRLGGSCMFWVANCQIHFFTANGAMYLEPSSLEGQASFKLAVDSQTLSPGLRSTPTLLFLLNHLLLSCWALEIASCKILLVA